MITKKNLRALALGFFLSGSLIAGYQYLEGDEEISPEANNNQEVEELKEEIVYLEEQLASIEVAQATEELEETEEQPEESEEEPIDEPSDEENSEENEESEEEEEPEEEVITATVTLQDGQPSSVATQQLADAGIIEDRLEFDLFLDNNDYAVLVRPGTYEVTSEMSFEEIAATLRGQ